MQLVGSPWQLQLQQITRVPAVHLHNSPPEVGYVTYLELAVVQSTLPHMKENVRTFNWIRHVKRLAMSLSQSNKAQQTKLFLLIEKRKFWARLKQDWRCRKSMYDTSLHLTAAHAWANVLVSIAGTCTYVVIVSLQLLIAYAFTRSHSIHMHTRSCISAHAAGMTIIMCTCAYAVLHARSHTPTHTFACTCTHKHTGQKLMT